MSDWWTYQLTDFLLFSADTYLRLFQLLHQALWPWQALALGVSLLLPLWVVRSVVVDPAPAWPARAALAVLGLAWLSVAWLFHAQRYASINWAAQGVAWLFMAQGLALLVVAAMWRSPRLSAAPSGLALLILAVLVYPVSGWHAPGLWPHAAVTPANPASAGESGAAWTWLPTDRLELFALTPDPTALATLGLLLCLRPGGRGGWVLCGIPLAWVAFSGATLWGLGLASALLAPAAAGLALGVAAVRWLASRWKAG